MSLPFFYVDGITGKESVITLNEDVSRHIVQVLRMKVSERLSLTDGSGSVYIAEILKEHKKATEVKIISAHTRPPSPTISTIAISFVKNASRFEWFLEKATELGINAIVPLICERTEKQHFRFDRMKNILISAMLQSQQCWLPSLSEPVLFDQFLLHDFKGKKLIAHCLEENKNELAVELKNEPAALILIGPEGDFTPDEIHRALLHECIPVSLGNTRLRTETAGVAAAVIMKIGGLP